MGVQDKYKEKSRVNISKVYFVNVMQIIAFIQVLGDPSTTVHIVIGKVIFFRWLNP